MRRRVHLAVTTLLVLVALSFRVAAAAGGATTAAASAGAPDGVPPEHLLPCLEELLPCLAYLRTPRHPSATCCTAMTHAAAAEMPCLCHLLADRVLLVTFNVTTDQMFRLPARCGLPVGCRAGTHEPWWKRRRRRPSGGETTTTATRPAAMGSGAPSGP
ncbi:hypothetical protein ACP70R_027295 [Stipagrostis hirtigluma subsp. patula]